MKAVPCARLALLAPLAALVGCQSEPGGHPLEPTLHSASMQFTPERTPWSAPVRLGPAISDPAWNDQNPTIASDGLSLYFCSDRPGGIGGNDIWVSRRATESADFETVANLGAAVNSTAGDCGATFSIDGRMMIFTSTRAGGAGGNDIYVTFRGDAGDDFAWAAPVRLGPEINTAMLELGPHLTRFRGDCGDADGEESTGEPCVAALYFDRGSATVPTEIHVVTIDRQGRALTQPAPVSELNSPDADGRTALRFDLREVMFQSTRDGRGILNVDLFGASRRSPNSPWDTPRPLDELNTADREFGPSLSRDGRTIYFTRGTGFTVNDIWMARR